MMPALSLRRTHGFTPLHFQENLGHPVRTFVSYGGPAYGAHAATDALITKAGYQFVFSNLRIQRLRG